MSPEEMHFAVKIATTTRNTRATLPTMASHKNATEKEKAKQL